MAGILAGSRRAVVARCARAQHLVMVNRNYRRPYGGIVAILADVGR